jgi:hypothetical protein
MAGRRVKIFADGLKNFAKSYAALGNSKVSVGITEEQGSKQVADGFSMADLAAVHEFGSMDGRIPERSFIRSTLREHRSQYLKELDRATDRALFSGTSAEAELKKLGEKVRSDIVQRIQDGRTHPPLAESTIRAKGSSLPLVDTGALVGSIRSKVESKK